MKYLTEFRDGEKARRLADEIRKRTTRKWAIMEVCGGQTHSIIRNGIDQILPPEIELIHGPGCPVCVTPVEIIDKALDIASRPGVTFCSFGDMLRVPGSKRDLLGVKSTGGDVRIVYSPLDALRIARNELDREVVFFAIGFETTAPANAMAVKLAKQQGIKNFSVLVSHVLVPPAIQAILNSPTNRVQAFLAAGHVCSVMGYWQYPPLSDRYHVPIVITGFEPLDILGGIRRAVMQLESATSQVENAFERVVTFDGNQLAQQVINEVFEVTDRSWRGIGRIPQSGWRLSHAYRDFDAETRFGVSGISSGELVLCQNGEVLDGSAARAEAHATCESTLCRSGEVLQGAIKPHQCAAFGNHCTPRTPLGATMVSSEGACAAYFNYGRFLNAEATA